MGSHYTVKAWMKIGVSYQWICIYNGQKMLPALFALWKNRHEYGCITLEVRLPND